MTCRRSTSNRDPSKTKRESKSDGQNAFPRRSAALAHVWPVDRSPYAGLLIRLNTVDRSLPVSAWPLAGATRVGPGPCTSPRAWR